MNKKGQKPPQGKPGKMPTLNDFLKIFEHEKKKRGHQRVFFMQGGFKKKVGKGDKKPGLGESILQHTKKKLDFFKS